MSAIWMTFWFYLPGAGRSDVPLGNSGIILNVSGLNAIWIKHNWVGRIKALTGWVSGLMQTGPPE